MRITLLLLGILCLATPLRAQELEAMAREIAAARWQQQPEESPGDNAALDKLKKASEGAYSLLIPGLAQLKQGNKTRAAIFFGAESAVWATWIVSRIQGAKREDAYQDYARQFAGIPAGEHDENYWEAIASYPDVDLYNDDVQRDLRLGADADGPLYGDEMAWRWASAERFRSYQKLRADSIGAYDRAETVLFFALLTRAIALIDGVRTAVRRPDGGGAALRFEPDYRSGDPGARLAFETSF